MFSTPYQVNHLFNIRRLLQLFILSLLIILLGCKEDQAPVQQRQAPKVTVAQTMTKTIEFYAIYTGSTKAFKSADVVARVAGRLESVDFKASSMVKKGDLLFHIEKEKYQAQHDSDHALLASARADLALATTEVKRMEQASKKNAVSELEVDKARANRDVATASVKSAQAALAESALQLSYTSVRSPIDGVVSREMVDAGNVVGQSSSTLLTRVNTMQPMFVYFSVPESMMLTFLDAFSERRSEDEGVRHKTEGIEKRALFAYVERANETGFPHKGRLDYIDNEVDQGTGTVEVRLLLDNDDSKFFPGLFVRIKVPGADIEKALLVKEAAVGSDLGGKYVLVVDKDNIVALRHVELGAPQEDGYVHIISGLEADESYIVKGLLRARPGLPVQPTTDEG